MNREKLISAGVDYDEGLKRFGGQARLFEKYLAKFFESSLMETLEQQLAQKDIAGAFHTAHDLKGTAGNLSLNACYKEIYALTELLRHGDSESDYSEALARVKALYNAALCAVKEE